MTSNLRRLIDLEIEAEMHDGLLPPLQERERKELLKRFESYEEITKRLEEEIRATENLIHEGEIGGIHLGDYLQNLRVIEGSLTTSGEQVSKA